MAGTHFTLNSEFDFSLIVFAVFLAVFVAYACIEFTRCIVLSPAKKRKHWIVGGAIVLGIGLWAAQLASMYALKLPIEIHYHLRPIALSLLIAILCAAAILNINTQQNLSTRRWILVSISVGLLITAMNIMGLQAIQTPATVTYHLGFISLAALLVIVATAIVSRQAVKFLNRHSLHDLQVHLVALFVGISLIGSNLLGIHALTFNIAELINSANSENNLYSYHVLIVGTITTFLLWGSILFSRWQANEGVKVASRIAGLAFGLVFITAGTIGAVAFISSKNMLTQQQLLSRLSKLELEAIQLQNISNSLMQDALVLAHTPPVLGLLRAQKNNGVDKQDSTPEEIWRDRLAAIFIGFLQSKPDYLQACYINIKNGGEEVVSVMRNGSNILRTTEKILGKEIQQAIFSRAKKNGNYQVFLSDIKPNSENKNPAILHASVPIRDDSGSLFGIIVINLNFSKVLNSTLQKMDEAHYFANPNGEIIFEKNQGESSPDTLSGSPEIQDIFPAMADIIDNPEKITGNLTDDDNHHSFYLNYRKIKLDPNQENYFLRITSTPYKNISNHVLPLLNQFSTIILVLIGISAIFASLLARIITRPLKQMTLATQQFACGNVTTPLPKSAAGEFGILARAFQDMVEKVEERGDAIAQSENFVRNIVNSVADGLVTVDENGIIRSFNTSAQSMFGYDEHEVIGNNVTKLIPMRFREKHDGHLKNYTKTPTEKTNPLRTNIIGLRKNNEEFPIELSVNRVRSSAKPLFIGIIRDITLREESIVNMQLVDKVLESTPEGIVITDANGIIVRTNPAFEDITGFSENEVIGKTPGLLKSGRHNNDFFQHMWNSIIEHGIWQGEIWDKRKSGEVYPKWLNISAIKNDDNIATHYVGLFSDITERKEVEKRLEHLAHYDMLTGLPNRALFHDRLLHSLEFARRSEKGLAVIMLDLDRFKVVNDTLGHDIGDLLLVETAKRLKKCLRKVDTVARMGGDEFTIILSDLTDASDAIQLAKVIIDTLAKPFTLSGHDCFVGVSIGISSFPTDGNSPQILAKNADTAMYRAKEMGRNTYQLFNASMSKQNAERLNIETKLRAAIQRDELELYYQPQINLNSGKISGMEVLLRWNHSELGMVPPTLFIPIAEASGLIIDIGEWILRAACQQYNHWMKAGLPNMSIMVNLSPQQIFQPNLAEVLLDFLDTSNMPAEKLILEISEGTLLDFPAHAITTLEKLSALGVQLSIDDYGTSYSSMGQLKNMPIQTLKIDQSFIQNIGEDGNSEEIVKAIIGMARNLNFQVVAEGVETMEQLTFLKLQGCDAMQGYLYSPPLPLKAIDYMLENKVTPSLFIPPAIENT